MNSIIEKVFDGFKKCTPALIAVLIFTGLVLFLPESILQKMMLESIPDLWRIVAGLLFLLSLALIISILCSMLYKTIIVTRKRHAFVKSRMKLINQLSVTQKRILISLLKSEEKMIELDSNSGNTIYLLNNGFIHQPQQIFTPYEDEIILRYVPQPWLMDMYQNNPRFRRMLEG